MHTGQVSISQLSDRFREELTGLYPEREIRSIFHLLMEGLNYKKTDIYLNFGARLQPGEGEWMRQALDQLKQHVPVQYILGYTWFCGLKILVRPGVLIPRPETEELVDWVLSENTKPGLHLMDIGCGSGCIALALKAKRPGWMITGMDSEKIPMEVSRENGSRLGLDVSWLEGDIMDITSFPTGNRYDLLVSNPPYVPVSEREEMSLHVAESEPAEALFVPDADPLLFYRALRDFALSGLSPGGLLYLEIHEKLGEETALLFSGEEWDHVRLKQDIHGKSRMLSVRKKEYI